MILLFFFLVPSGGFPCLLLAGWPYNFLSALGQAGCWASGSTVSAGVCPNLLWYYIISSYRCVWGELSGYEGHRGPMYRMETAACSCVLGDRVPAMLSSFCTLLTFCFLECFFLSVCVCRSSVRLSTCCVSLFGTTGGFRLLVPALPSWLCWQYPVSLLFVFILSFILQYLL